MAVPDPKTVLATISAMRAVAADYKNLPEKSREIDLTKHVMALQVDFGDLLQALHETQQRVRDLEGALAAVRGSLAEGLTFDREVYWASEEREPSADGPFCPLCVDRGTGRRRLKKEHGVYARCPECEGRYYVWPEKDTPPAPRVVRNWLSPW